MIYIHNPKCTKSRQGLEYLTEKGFSPTVIQYLSETLDPTLLKTLFEKTATDPNPVIRQKEAKTLGLADLSEEGWIQAIQDHPILLERPILLTDSEAIIGRPHERLRDFVDQLPQP